MKFNRLNFFQKHDGFLLIEALVALAILTCSVKAIVHMHAGLFVLQKSVTNRMHILECESKSIERAHGNCLFQDSLPAAHDGNELKKCCSVVCNVLHINFVVESQGSCAFHKQKLSLPCHYLGIQNHTLQKKAVYRVY